VERALEILKNHTSVRKYTDKPIDLETKSKIIESACMAPTSSHIQAYTIIEVVDEEKRRLLSEYAGGQKWVVDAPLLLLFCGDLHRARKYFKAVNPDIYSNTELFSVAVIDTALAAQKALVTAQLMDLGGVFIGGIRNKVEEVSRLFDLPNLVFPLFALCLGYPAESNGIKPRLPKGVIHKLDTYSDYDDEKLIKEYDMDMKDYYIERTEGKESDTWTERSGVYLNQKPRYNVGEHFRNIGLLKK
jgi:nitroreductase/FMN reductase (NADPH)